MELLRTHSSNTVSKELLILLSINNSIGKISLYELSRPKFNCGGYMIFELTFKAFKPHDFAFYLLRIIDSWVTQFHILFCLLFASKMRKIMDTVFEFVYVITPFLFSNSTWTTYSWMFAHKNHRMKYFENAL